MKLYHKDHECGPGCNHEDHQVEKVETVRVIPEKKKQQITFANFLNFFEPVELPFTITSDTQRVLSQHTDPLSASWMFNFVLREDEVIDEYTEFMPCFSLTGLDDIIAIVYWESGLQGSTYYLTSFSKDGYLIDKNKIAGTNYDSDGLWQMVCTIGEDFTFSCVEGRLDEKGNSIPVSPDKSHHHTYQQLSADGEIIQL